MSLAKIQGLAARWRNVRWWEKDGNSLQGEIWWDGAVTGEGAHLLGTKEAVARDGSRIAREASWSAERVRV